MIKIKDLDRSRWDFDPDDEPDRAYWQDDYTGYDCHVMRNGTGAWCGYVKLGKGHPLFGVRYGDNIDMPKSFYENTDRDFTSHRTNPISLFLDMMNDDGGTSLGVVIEVHGGLTYSEFEGDDWVIGFDCAHWGDRRPFGDNENGTYRDFDYAVSEVTSMAAQLKQFENRD